MDTEACLGDFIYMVNLIKAKNCDTITYVEVPTELLHPTYLQTSRKGQTQQEKRKFSQEQGSTLLEPSSCKKTKIDDPYSKELANFSGNL